MTRILRFPEVKQRTGISRSTIWRLESGGKFPTRVHPSRNTVGWLEHEVDAWIATTGDERGRSDRAA